MNGLRSTRTRSWTTTARAYLFYARDLLDGDRVGTSIAADRLVSPVELAGSPVPVLTPSADWQLYRRGRQMYGSVYDWHTLEGPFVRRRLGRYWLLYSGGAWTGESYAVSWAVADRPLGPWVHAGPDVPALLRTVPGLVGPGHCSVVEGPDGGDWLAYHAWDPGLTARRMCLDRIEWTPDGPGTPGPTTLRSWSRSRQRRRSPHRTVPPWWWFVHSPRGQPGHVHGAGDGCGSDVGPWTTGLPSSNVTRSSHRARRPPTLSPTSAGSHAWYAIHRSPSPSTNRLW